MRGKDTNNALQKTTINSNQKPASKTTEYIEMPSLADEGLRNLITADSKFGFSTINCYKVGSRDTAINDYVQKWLYSLEYQVVIDLYNL